MVAGGFLAGGAFLASGLLELRLELTYPHLPRAGTASLNVINTLSCPVVITTGLKNEQVIPNVSAEAMDVIKGIPTKNFSEFYCEITAVGRCASGHKLLRSTKVLFAILKELQTETAIISLTDLDEIRVAVTDAVEYSKSLSGKSRLRYGRHQNSSGELTYLSFF